MICVQLQDAKWFSSNFVQVNWTRDAFNEVSSTLSESLLVALAKLKQQHDELKHQQTDLSNRINTMNVSKNPNARNNSFNRRQTGNYRFKNRRGFRGQGISNKARGRFSNNIGYFNGNQNRINHNFHFNYNTPQIQESTYQEHIAAETTYSKQVCYICGYASHYATKGDQ